MRTITTKTKVYKFDELTEEAKQKAIDSQRDCNTDFEWWDFIYDDFIEICKILGIVTDSKNIYFRGFSSQGDGASFQGSYSYSKESAKQIRSYAPNDTALHSIADRLVIEQRPAFYKYECSIKQSGHYCHEMTMGIDGETELGEADEMEFLDIFRDLAKWLYKRLESNYDYLTSDKAIIETIKSNEWEFLIDGTPH